MTNAANAQAALIRASWADGTTTEVQKEWVCDANGRNRRCTAFTPIKEATDDRKAAAAQFIPSLLGHKAACVLKAMDASVSYTFDQLAERASKHYRGKVLAVDAKEIARALKTLGLAHFPQGKGYRLTPKGVKFRDLLLAADKARLSEAK